MAEQINVVERGPDGGAPLILVHGIGGSWRHWETTLDAFAAAGRRVLAVDLPGFGQSPPLAEPVSVGALADAVERTMARRGLDHPDIAGNSLGGGIALELARRGRVGRTVAISPIGGAGLGGRLWARAALEGQYRIGRAVAPRAERLLARRRLRRALTLLGAGDGGRVDPGVFVRAAADLASGPGYGDTIGPTASWRPRAELGEILSPVRLLWGTRDRLLSSRGALRLARDIPGATIEVLDGLGHVPMFDDGPRVARRVLAFVDAQNDRR